MILQQGRPICPPGGVWDCGSPGDQFACVIKLNKSYGYRAGRTRPCGTVGSAGKPAVSRRACERANAAYCWSYVSLRR